MEALMLKLFLLLFLLSVLSILNSGCSDSDSSITAVEQKEIIEIGDTLPHVLEVYGEPSHSFYYIFEKNRFSGPGYIFIYDKFELTFYFDDSSPRKVFYIHGDQN